MSQNQISLTPHVRKPAPGDRGRGLADPCTEQYECCARNYSGYGKKCALLGFTLGVSVLALSITSWGKGGGDASAVLLPVSSEPPTLPASLISSGVDWVAAGVRIVGSFSSTDCSLKHKPRVEKISLLRWRAVRRKIDTDVRLHSHSANTW